MLIVLHIIQAAAEEAIRESRAEANRTARNVFKGTVIASLITLLGLGGAFFWFSMAGMGSLNNLRVCRQKIMIMS